MYLAGTAHYRNRERFEDQLYLFGLLVTTGATKRVLLATEVVGDMLTCIMHKRSIHRWRIHLCSGDLRRRL
jgi:hypothetical protein